MSACPSQARSVVDSPSPGGGVDVAGDRAAGMRLAEHAPPVGLADGDVARRQVGHDGRAGHGGEARGRDRRPHVLADLDVQRQMGEVLAVEQQLGAERDRGPAELDLGGHGVPGGAELALLVVLAVLREVALGDDAEDPAAVQDDRRVVDRPVERPAARRRSAPGPALRSPSRRRAITSRTASSTACWWNRSSIEYPERPSSGKASTDAPAASARRASSSVRSRLYCGSAIRTCGTAAAMRTNPWLSRESKSVMRRRGVTEAVRG